MRIRSALIVAAITVAAAFYMVGAPNPYIDAQPLGQGRQLKQIDPVQSWPAKGKRWALVIGVDQYADTQITTLGGASNDAKSIAGALVRYAGFPAEQVTLLASDQPAERQPTRGNILRRLSNMAAVLPKDGLLLISFAGHGIERGGQAFLLPSDAQVANDVELLEQTAINVTQMKDRIRKTGVAQVVMILDACRNDPVGRGTADNPLTAAYTRGFDFDVRNREVTAFATLYATAVGQRAYEYKEKHQGYFTWELVEGLKGAAANEKGEVTLSSLVRYLQEHVPKHVLSDLGAGKEQRPFAVVAGYRADDLVIAVSRPAGSAAPNSPTGSSSVDPVAIELSFWETIKSSTDPEDFKAYLRKYPNGQFADLARRRAGPSPTGSGATPAAVSGAPASGKKGSPSSGNTTSGVGCGIGTTWDEVEAGGTWTSVWTRRGNSNVFDVNFLNFRVSTVNTVTLLGNHITIKRTQSSDNNLCTYDGAIAPDGVTVTGKYSCNRGGGNWSATIHCLTALSTPGKTVPPVTSSSEECLDFGGEWTSPGVNTMKLSQHGCNLESDPFMGGGITHTLTGLVTGARADITIKREVTGNGACVTLMTGDLRHTGYKLIQNITGTDGKCVRENPALTMTFKETRVWTLKITR
jgi:hypothetical protein